MAGRIEDILAECIADIRAGRAGLEDCLRRHPRLRGEIEPLLRIALSIEPPHTSGPSDAFKSRTRSNLIAHINAARPQPGFRTRRLPMPPNPFSARNRLRFAAVAAAFLIGIASVTGGTAYASQHAMPGDILYPQKTFIEDARLFFSFAAESRAMTHLDIADTRIDELSRLPGDRSRFIDGMMESYQYHLSQGLNIVEEQAEDGGDMQVLLSAFQERIGYQQVSLQNACDRVHEQALSAVRNAVNMSAGQLDRANRLMAQSHIENAAAIMNRIGEAAGSGDTDAVNHLLQQYDESLSGIIDSAGKTEHAGDVLEQARDRLENAFGQIPSGISEQAGNAIEHARQKTIQGLGKAAEAVDNESTLQDIWEDFETEWGEFMNRYQGEGAPGSGEWLEFDQLWPAPDISRGNAEENGNGSGGGSTNSYPQPTVTPAIEIEIITEIIPLP